ncbi:hypothetical protein KJ819_02400 [Patescibacteria group bacterium]|nr:hypothetical protein [Patescibacteria group bacterium]MBU1500867.1 hypothetical protein [Patescibacteria group bacterium]MBU2080922.1 hypothetical protein [Patescibacteria group bacterium]MBU2124027.1 hypothetical protein [Patescibacteria group bacterium]MBU2194682.1 hypothetical protein [Patescibacteria group bacterium]
MSTSGTPLEKIIDALELDQLPADEQEEIMSDIGALIFQSTMMNLMQVMDPETKEEFGKMVESDASEDEVSAFISSRVPNSDTIVQSTIDEMVDDILAVTGPVAA